MNNVQGQTPQSVKVCYQKISALADKTHEIQEEMNRNTKKFWKNLLGGGRTSAGGLLSGGNRQLQSLTKQGVFVRLFVSTNSEDFKRITKVIYHLPSNGFPTSEIESTDKELGFPYEIFTYDPFKLSIDIYSVNDRNVETVETSELQIILTKEKDCTR